MKFYITSFPIDSAFLKKHDLYDHEVTNSVSVGKITKLYIKNGYTEVNSSYDHTRDQFNMHFVKKIDENGKFI